MKKITTLIIAFSWWVPCMRMIIKKKKRTPNMLLSAKECMETKSGIGWFLGCG